MAFELWQAARPKGRSPQWAYRIAAGGSVVFESPWVAVRYAARRDAEWLAATIDRLAGRGLFAGCPGHPGQRPPLLWRDGDIGTDHGFSVGGITGHAEHLFGPVRGGAWYCQVHRGNEQYFHTAETGVSPRSGSAAWWICETVLGAVQNGLWEPCRHNSPIPASL